MKYFQNRWAANSCRELLFLSLKMRSYFRWVTVNIQGQYFALFYFLVLHAHRLLNKINIYSRKSKCDIQYSYFDSCGVGYGTGPINMKVFGTNS